MTLLDRPRTGTAVPLPAERDTAMDLVRAFCLVVVVALHAFMAGIAAPGGEIVVTNVVEGQAWFAPVSWLVQVMPLFFIVGGFAGITHWRRTRARGGTAAGFVAGRLRRLAVPAIAAFITIGVGLSIALVAGVSPDLVAELGFRMAQPMWFLAVYLGATALVPALAWCHERAPWITIGMLVLGVVAVDAARLESGVAGLGYLNLGFVWLAIQQLGFWWADGRIAGLSRNRLWVGLVASIGLLVALVASGTYSADMYVNLNPPTLCLVVLGLAQFFALALAAPALRRAAARPRIAGAIELIGTRSMTIYLWHMPALVLLAGVLFAAGLPFAEPLSAEWWMTRPAWLVGVGVAAALLVRAAEGFERRGGRAAGTATGRRIALAVALAVVGVVGVLAMGFTPVSALVAVAALAVAIRLTAPARRVSLVG